MIKILITLGLGTLIWSGVCETTIAADAPATMPQAQPVIDALSKPSASSSSAATQALKKPTGIRAIVAEVQALRSNGIPSSIVFAKELVSILTKHKILLPDDLGRLGVPKPPVPRPTGDEVSRMCRHGRRIVSICEQSTWTKIVDFGISVPLRNDLLMTVAKHCPSSLARVEAAMMLVMRAMPDGEGKRVPDVSPAMASEASEDAITHALDVSSGSLGPDAIPAIKTQGFGLVTYGILLKAMALDKLATDALDKTITDLDTRVAAALRVETVESSRKTLELFQEQLKSVKAQVPQLLQQVSYMNEVRELLEAVIDAINKEDKEAAAKYLTAKTQSRWAKKKSLRAMLARSSNAQEIKFLALGPIGTRGKSFQAIATCAVIDDKGQSKRKVWTPYLVKTDTGWLLGQE